MAAAQAVSGEVAVDCENSTHILASAMATSDASTMSIGESRYCSMSPAIRSSNSSSQLRDDKQPIAYHLPQAVLSVPVELLPTKYIASVNAGSVVTIGVERSGRARMQRSWYASSG